MANLFSTLQAAAGTIGVYERALSVTQNNVSNVSTPGYARQIQDLEALPFDPDSGLSGGVGAGTVQSTRDIYAEAAVERSVSSLGTWEQQVETLTPVETGLDISGESGIAGALSDLYASFSTWSASPNDGTARQEVLNAAQTVCDAFQQTADTLTQAANDADSRLTGLVDQVNELAGKVRDYNVARGANGTQDSALEASLYSTLEELSEIANISTLRQSDGSVTLLLGGQTPLVIGDNQYQISADFSVPASPTYSGAPPTAYVLDSTGRDITSQITQGRIAGLLTARNDVLASLVGDSDQVGDLNRLAQTVADRINEILTSGNISNGPPAVGGVALFSYDTTNPSTIARTLSLNSAITADQLAAISTGTNASANGVPLALAALESPQSSADQIDNVSYTQFYGQLAARIGSAISTAEENQAVQQDVVTQTRDLREQSSGVSLDQEAINLLEYQRAYQATAKMITVLDNLTETVIGLLQ